MYFVVRSFDHGGYYETRFILCVGAFIYALWRWWKGDPRFLIAFVSGVFFQGLMEWILSLGGQRGGHFSFGFFGYDMVGFGGHMVQGLLEGGPLSLMGYWFVDLFRGGPPRKGAFGPYLVALLGIFILAMIVTIAAQGLPTTSVRPMFQRDPLWLGTIAASVVLTLVFRGLRGLRLLALFLAGVSVYAVVTFAPMDAGLVRYIGERTASGLRPVGPELQVLLMAYSLVVEVAISKLHYFALPLIFGLLDAPASPRNPRATLVVFLHGWLMSPDIWDQSIAALPPGWKGLAVWQPGHGSEPASPVNFTMDDWALWLFAKLDALGATRVVLVGHSMGGMLAANAAIMRPERIAGVVLVGSTTCSWTPEAVASWRETSRAVALSWSVELAASIAPVLLSARFIESHRAWVRKWVRRVAGFDRAGMAGITAAIADRRDVTDNLAALRLPTLVAHGQDDTAIPFGEGERMAARLGATFVGFEKVGHCPPLEAGDSFAAALKKFLQSIKTTRSHNARPPVLVDS